MITLLGVGVLRQVAKSVPRPVPADWSQANRARLQDMLAGFLFFIAVGAGLCLVAAVVALLRRTRVFVLSAQVLDL